MPHRLKNEHNSRHHTHAVKPANLYIGPLGQVLKPVAAPVRDEQSPDVIDAVVAVGDVPPAV